MFFLLELYNRIEGKSILKFVFFEAKFVRAHGHGKTSDGQGARTDGHGSSAGRTKRSPRKEKKKMWLDKLKELKAKKGLTSKQIAELTNLPEKTVSRIFSGDTPNPYVDTLCRIVEGLDACLDDVLTDTKTVVGDTNLATLQAEVDRLAAENAIISAEQVVLKEKVNALSAENDLLRLKLEHKDEIIALHNYYNKMRLAE